MSAHAEPIYWPESVEVPKHEEIPSNAPRVVYVRYRAGKSMITRLILEPGDALQTLVK